MGDHVQRQTQLTSGSHQRMNAYSASIDMVLSELEFRFSRNNLCVGNICYSETPDKESFFGDAKSYKIGGEILEAEKKVYARFRLVRGLGHK